MTFLKLEDQVSKYFMKNEKQFKTNWESQFSGKRVDRKKLKVKDARPILEEMEVYWKWLGSHVTKVVTIAGFVGDSRKRCWTTTT